MDFLQVAVLGVVEGVSEFLPISSTGHLILAGKLLGLPDTEFQKSFNIVIQLGAILAVVVLYWKKFLLDHKSLMNVMMAFIPTAMIGFLLYKVAKQYLLGSATLVAWSLVIGGIVMIAFEKYHKESGKAVSSVGNMTWKQCVLIGLLQCVAIIPGVSRSASTIFAGLFLGLDRKTAVEFSFLLAVPVMAAATGLDLLKNHDSFSRNDWGVLAIGFIVSFLVALAAIKFLISYIKKNDFTWFGVYRIIVGIIFLLFV